MKTGINYLIQMHVGMFFILIAFLIVGKETGEISFDALGLSFQTIQICSVFAVFYRIRNQGWFHTAAYLASPGSSCSTFACFGCYVGGDDQNGDLWYSQGTACPFSLICFRLESLFLSFHWFPVSLVL